MTKSLLKDFTEEELQAELEAREKKRSQVISPLIDPNFDALVSMIKEGVSRSAANEYESADFPHYVYEAAMEAVYGAGYWKWRNAQNW